MKPNAANLLPGGIPDQMAARAEKDTRDRREAGVSPAGWVVPLERHRSLGCDAGLGVKWPWGTMSLS